MKRKTKKKVRKAILGIMFGTVILTGLSILVFSVKNVLPLLKIGSEQNSVILKPVIELTTRENLRRTLSDNNFIMDSLVESSSSAVIIGEIRDGPKVYFTKDKDAESQVESLSLILARFSIEDKTPVIVDLRFDQPIVKF